MKHMKQLAKSRVVGKKRVNLLLRMPKSLHIMLVSTAKRSGQSLNDEMCWRLSLGLARELIVTVIPDDIKTRIVRKKR